MDIPLGSPFKDGIGASPLISRFEVSNPADFIPVITDETTDDLINLSYSRWLDEPESYGKEICSVVSKFLKLKVFYVLIR